MEWIRSKYRRVIHWLASRLRGLQIDEGVVVVFDYANTDEHPDVKKVLAVGVAARTHWSAPKFEVWCHNEDEIDFPSNRSFQLVCYTSANRPEYLKDLMQKVCSSENQATIEKAMTDLLDSNSNEKAWVRPYPSQIASGPTTDGRTFFIQDAPGELDSQVRGMFDIRRVGTRWLETVLTDIDLKFPFEENLHFWRVEKRHLDTNVVASIEELENLDAVKIEAAIRAIFRKQSNKETLLTRGVIDVLRSNPNQTKGC